MKVVNSTHQDRAVGGVNAAAGTKPELWNHPAQAHQQTSYQAPEGPLWVKVGITMTSLGWGGVRQSSHRFVDPLHEHGQEEDRGDGRSQVAGHGLDVIEELAALRRLDDGDPADADGHDAQDPDSGDGRGAAAGMPQAPGADHRTSPAHDEELPLAGLGPEAGPDVHGEQGAAAVEDGGQGGHEGGQHHRQHQPS